MGKADIKARRPQRQESCVGRSGGNTHYFVIQACAAWHGRGERHTNHQTGAARRPWRRCSAATSIGRRLVAPGDFQVASRGYRYVVNGFDLKIPYAATCVVTLRSLINKRGPVISRFMRAMAEASKLMHGDRALVYKVLGKYLRITDQKSSTHPTIPKSPPWNIG